MRSWLFIGYSLAVAGCSFQSAAPVDGSTSTDGAQFDATSVDGPTSDASNIFMVDHVGVVQPAKLSTSFTVPAGDHNIDTSNPGGFLTLQIVAQAGGGPELAIAYFDELIITGNLYLYGTHPLVLVANKITVMGAVNASAGGVEPGPGGGKPGSTDPGTGGDGTSAVGLNNSGGGGGGFGSTGAAGGNGGATLAGSAGAADAFPLVPRLRGGGAGGAAARCASATGGGGGGAVQLSARLTLQISGVVEANGGGGLGGGFCGALDAGSGGGAGGAVFLQAPSITMSGSVFANGGAGGAGGGPTTAPPTANAPAGSDGLTARQVALGGASINGDRNGGNGAAFNGTSLINATSGGAATNGGGGGGGGGRIVIHGGFTGSRMFSPEPAFF